MKSSRIVLHVSRLLLMCAVGATAANALQVTFHFTSVSVPGAVQTYPSGINNAGVVVGTYQDSANATHGFILQGQKVMTLDVPNGTNTSVGHVNRTSSTVEVVGSYKNSAGRYLGFLYKNGRYVDIPGPKGCTSSSAQGINSYGMVVGSYTDSSNVTHGYLLTNRGYTALNVSMAQIVVATGINDQGQIVLWAVNGLFGTGTSYLYDIKTKQYTTIDVPEASQGSYAQDIDNAGDVTYQWVDSSSVSHGALLHAGNYYTFDYPNSVWDYGSGINDHNVIVGSYETVSNGPFSGFEAIY